MRIKLMIILAFIIISTLLSAEIIEFTYNFENPQIEKNGNYNIVSFENTRQVGKTGEPVLPYRAVKLLLPQGHKAISVQYEWNDLKTIDKKLKLYPKQFVQPVSHGKSGGFAYSTKVYSSYKPYPSEKNGKVSTEYMNGYGFALTTFTPAEYIPAQQQLSYYSSVTIKIKTAIDSQYQRQNLSSRPEVLQRVQNFAQNPEMLFRYSVRNTRSDDYELLVITSEEYSDNFADYIDFYLERATRTEVVTLNYINNNVSGQDVQERMRNYIIQEYQDHNLAYVLLAGDVEIVPYRGFYCQVQSSSVYESDDIPADIYFSALDGNWNDDGDNNWGEPEEDDLLPDVAVARFSFSDETELNNMLNKTFDYQNDPVLGELDKPLLAGEHLYDNPETWGGDYLDLLIGYHEDNGYTTEGIPETDNYETLYARDTGYWNASTLINKLNQGKSFLHHVGHANESTVANLYISDITNSNFYNLNGEDHNYTLMYSHGCTCASFDNDDCIAEHMVKIENFLTAFIGNSRYGWFNEGQTEGPSPHIHREFVDALYRSKNNRLGATHMESKIETAPWVEAPDQWEEGALRWCFYDCNVLGDVMTSVWTAEPVDIDINSDEVIVMGSESFQVEVSDGGNGLGNFYCAVVKDGILYGRGQTDGSGNATIIFEQEFTEPGIAELIVSGYNCLPQYVEIPVIVTGDIPYLVIDDVQINSGDDQVIEFGENTEITITLKNVGNQPANNILGSVQCGDEYIAILEDELELTTIAAGETATFTQPFIFAVSNQVPDAHNFNINLATSSDEGNWSSEISLTAYAPVLEVATNITVDDGDNGRLDPGDTADLYVPIENLGGAAATNISALLSSEDELITINSDSDEIAELLAAGSAEVMFNVSVAEEAEIGHVANFMVDLTADNDYASSSDFGLNIGLCFEDFESGSFVMYPWEFDGAADWFLTESSAYEGLYAAQSGDISDNQESTLEVELDVIAAAEMSFWVKVSSEGNWDYLRFYVDNNQLGEWSGEVGWTEQTYEIEAGNHTFKWSYEKDTSVSSGSDCGWVDYIIFPPVIVPAAPQMAVDIDAITMEMGQNETGTEAFEISNVGGGSIDYSISIYNPERGEKSLEGSTLECDTSEFMPGENATWTFTAYNGSTDNEWIEEIYIQFPAGVTVESATDFSGSSPIIWDGSSGNGVETAWIEGGYIGDDATGTAAVEVSIDAGFSGDVVLEYTFVGDVYGDPPHEVSGELTIVSMGEPITWLTVEPSSGSLLGGQSEEISVNFDTSDMALGNYECSLMIDDGYGNVVEIPVSLVVAESGNEGVLPAVTELQGNYPNPFNPETTSNFSLKETGQVKLEVYNIKGQKVKTLVNQEMSAGQHSVLWSGRDDSGNSVSSGVYFFRMTNGRYTSTRKMILMK